MMHGDSPNFGHGGADLVGSHAVGEDGFIGFARDNVVGEASCSKACCHRCFENT